MGTKAFKKIEAGLAEALGRVHIFGEELESIGIRLGGLVKLLIRERQVALGHQRLELGPASFLFLLLFVLRVILGDRGSFRLRGADHRRLATTGPQDARAHEQHAEPFECLLRHEITPAPPPPPAAPPAIVP